MWKKSIRLILLLGLILVLLTGCNKKQDTIITDANGSIQITVPGNLKFENLPSSNGTYDIGVYSNSEDIYIYINSSINMTGKEIETIAKEDMENNVPTMNNARDVSELSKIEIQDYTAYTYHYTYTDGQYNKDYYSQIVWIQAGEKVYLMNLEVNRNNIDTYQTTLNTIITSFKVLS